MQEGNRVLGEYLIGESIGYGGYGWVYKGEDRNGVPVAIKKERTYSHISRPFLQHEANLYNLLSGHPCIPSFKAYGQEGRWSIMVLELLGHDLGKLLTTCGGRFTLKTTLMIAFNALTCLEYIHSRGFIHRDIKPGNFLIGLGQAPQLHIIDFGLARRYKNPVNGMHYPYADDTGLIGTTRFASVNGHYGRALSRRDDLESLSYTLIYFLRGRLPWQGIQGPTIKKADWRIRHKKTTWTAARLCEGMAPEFQLLLDYSRKMEFEQTPDYPYLKNLFLRRLKEEGHELDQQYDWMLHGEQSIYSSIDRTDVTGPPMTPPFSSPNSAMLAKGDFILVKLLARETMEYPPDSSFKDQSYLHDSSLSHNMWRSPYRPAVVVDVRPGREFTSLTVLPLMRRSKGLVGVAHRRREAFMSLRCGTTDVQGHSVATDPPWHLDNTFLYLTHGYEVNRTLVVAVQREMAQSTHVHWRLHHTDALDIDEWRDSVLPVITDASVHSSDGEATRAAMNTVRKPKGLSFASNFRVFANIAPLTPRSLFEGVEWHSSVGWLTEFNMLNARHRAENEADLESAENGDSDENVSMYTGPVPADRLASCTVAWPTSQQ